VDNFQIDDLYLLDFFSVPSYQFSRLLMTGQHVYGAFIPFWGQATPRAHRLNSFSPSTLFGSVWFGSARIRIHSATSRCHSPEIFTATGGKWVGRLRAEALALGHPHPHPHPHPQNRNRVNGKYTLLPLSAK